jgi:broad specificity polyphosphatase/5'/3'-nucleotidase SurE
MPGLAVGQVDVQRRHRDAPVVNGVEVGPLQRGAGPANVVMNINFPDLEPERIEAVEMTELGFRDYHPMHFERRKDLRGRDYFWMGFRGRPCTALEGTDLHAVHNGRISVTPLHIDLTHRQTWHELKGKLGGPPPKLHKPDASFETPAGAGSSG